MSKVLITSAYPQFTRKVKEICEDKGVDAIVIEAVLEDAVNRVRECIYNNSVDVIISRAGTAKALSQALNVPVITAEANDFDILDAMWRAKKVDDKIAYLGFNYGDYTRDFSKLQAMIGVEIKQYTYENSREIKASVEQVYQEGFKVIVCGGYSAIEQAAKMGMTGIIVHSSQRTILQAIKRAQDVVEIRQRDKEYSLRLNTIIGNIQDGIISLNDQNEVLFINKAARKMLNVGADISKEKVSNLIKNKKLESLLAKKAAFTGELMEKEGLAVSSVPVTSEEKKYGRIITLQDISRVQRLEHKIRTRMYSQGLVAKFSFEDIVGESITIKEIIEKAKKFSETDSTILLTGESGTGKEMFAQSIHNSSQRKNGPFVAINCAALPENLLESELFGYEEGAFTGAVKGGKAGLFELAHRGTIFLDEIGSVNTGLQGRLLRVLQEREVMRVGGNQIIPVDIRIIAATNEDLGSKVLKGEFRSDLFYRLNVLNLTLPPLRSRKGDPELLLEYFAGKFNRDFRKEVHIKNNTLYSWANSYSWPGNVRQLENFVERLIILAKEAGAVEEDLVRRLTLETEQELYMKDREGVESVAGDDKISISVGTMAEMEREIIYKVAELKSCSKEELAKSLQISRTTLWKKLRN